MGKGAQAGCSGLLRSQRKGGLKDRFRGLAREELQFRRRTPVWGAEEKGRGVACPWEGEPAPGELPTMVEMFWNIRSFSARGMGLGGCEFSTLFCFN